MCALTPLLTRIRFRRPVAKLNLVKSSPLLLIIMLTLTPTVIGGPFLLARVLMTIALLEIPIAEGGNLCMATLLCGIRIPLVTVSLLFPTETPRLGVILSPVQGLMAIGNREFPSVRLMISVRF